MMSDSVKIVVNGLPVPLEDWSKAKRAIPNELPRLGEAQREAARKLDVSEVDYARSLLAQKYGAERVQGRAERFAAVLDDLLLSSHIAGGAVKIENRPNEDVWAANIGFKSEIGCIQIPAELFDDILDDPGGNANYTKYLQGKLRSLVRKSLNLGDAA